MESTLQMEVWRFRQVCVCVRGALQVCRRMHGQTVSKWEVVQEVLPKQAPDAA